jgi:hypothetical protein
VQTWRVMKEHRQGQTWRQLHHNGLPEPTTLHAARMEMLQGAQAALILRPFDEVYPFSVSKECFDCSDRISVSSLDKASTYQKICLALQELCIKALNATRVRCSAAGRAWTPRVGRLARRYRKTIACNVLERTPGHPHD